MQLIVETYYTQMMGMPEGANKTASLRTMFDTIEQYLRSLDALGQDINQRKIISLIRNKLPNVVTIYSEQQKGTEKEGSAEMLPLSLKGYITTQENTENQYQVHMKRTVMNREYKNHSKRKSLEQ